MQTTSFRYIYGLKIENNVFTNAYNHFNCFFHRRNGNILIKTMEIVTACKKIGARKSHKGKLYTVCTFKNTAFVLYSLFIVPFCI